MKSGSCGTLFEGCSVCSIPNGQLQKSIELHKDVSIHAILLRFSYSLHELASLIKLNLRVLCDVCTHYAVGHQGSLHETCQDISRMVLVVGDT